MFFETTFVVTSADLTPEVSERLTEGHYGWLTTVAKSGQPVPVGHVKRHPQVSLNLDSDGNGGGIIAIGGAATVDAKGADCRDDAPYWAKYGALADQFGLSDAMASYSTRLRISSDK